MNILIALLLILLALPCEARLVLAIGGGVTVCSSSNDSVKWHPTTQPGTTANTNLWLATKFTTASAYTITGYNARLCNGGTAGNVTLRLMNHNSTEPDETSVVADSTSQNVANTSLETCATTGMAELLLSATIALPAGTYWIVKEAAAGVASGHFVSSVGDRACYSSDSGSSWTCAADYTYDFELLGCN